MKNFYVFLILLFSASLAKAQTPNDTASYPYWIEMMQDFRINYFTTVHAFEKYYENRVVEPHTGYKTFKRWQEYWRTRVDDNGNFPAPDADWNAYFNYFGYPNSRSTLSVSGNWQPLGPVALPANFTGQPNGNGRINAIAFHPTDSNKIYVGAPQGGLWSTSDGGLTWVSNTDNLPTLGVSAILIDYSNPNIMYIGSGDRDAGDSQGLGILKSTNGGSTWTQINTGLGNVTVGMMEMNKKNPNIIIAATSSGIFKTFNGGTSWSRKSSNTNNYKDVKYHPTDTSIVYAVEGVIFYRSTDGGNTFAAVNGGTTGLTTTGNRAVIGVSPAAPDMVYVLQSNGTYKGTYLSRDKGQTFVTKSTTPNIFDYASNGSGTGTQAWYDMTICIDTANFGTVYMGGVNVFRSLDSGATWTCYGHWVGSGAPALHADQHQFRIDPKTYKLYCGNDGGLYSRAPWQSQFTNLTSGLNISQIYRIGQSAQSPSIVIAGWQDNGTGVYRESLGTNKWRTTMGGDGMECIIDPTDSNYQYGALYYGDIRRTSSGSTLGTGVAGNGTNGINESGAWVTPYILHNKNPNVMFVGYKNLWRGTNVKGTPTFTKITTGSASNITAIEHCEGDTSRLYYSRSDAKLFRTDNLSLTTPTFLDITSRTPVPTSTVQWIETHPNKPKTVYIIQSNAVYRSNDTGNTWTNINGTLPSSTKNCLLLDKQATDGIYVGTDVGVFYRDSTMTDWVPFRTGLPSSSRITELEMFYDYANTTACRISASTYGRGLWQSDVYLTNSAPVANFKSDTQACTNRTIILQDLSTKSPDQWLWTITPATYTFVNGTSATSQNPQVQFTATGNYTVKLYAKRNGWGYSTITKSNYITVGSNPPTVGASANLTTICKGTSVNLSATGASTYTWYGNNVVVGNTANITVTPSVTTRYVAYGSNGQCLDSAVVNVTVNSVTGISLNTTSITTCEGLGVLLVASGASSYAWSPSTGLSTTTGSTVTATPATTTRYTCTFTGSNSCTDTLSVLVSVKPKPVLSVTGGLIICTGTSTTLTATGAGTYAWYNGTTLIGSNASITLNPTGNTTYKLKGTLNGCSDSTNVTVTVVNKPTVSVSGTLSICTGSSTILTATGTNSYKWYNGTTLIGSTAAITLNPTSTTTYKVVGTIGSAACSDSTNVTVTVNNLPTITVTPSSGKIAAGQFVFLTASGASTYTWAPAAGLNTITGATVIASPSVTTTYTVTGKDANNCESTKQVTVTLAASGIPATVTGKSIYIQPNPTEDDVNIIMPMAGTMELMDISGKVIAVYTLNEGSNMLHLGKLPKAVYTAAFTMNDEKSYQRIIVK